jgi:GNAT superfamily N-acetyltransferase
MTVRSLSAGLKAEITFRPYVNGDMEICLALFDANCPEFFAPNERSDYVRFLEASPKGYELCLVDGQVVGAFGLMGTGRVRRSLNWILLDPRFQGFGAGRAIMNRVAAHAASAAVEIVDIAASHKSVPFFEKFGAVTMTVTENGWGPGMHRVDMELRI